MRRAAEGASRRAVFLGLGALGVALPRDAVSAASAAPLAPAQIAGHEVLAHVPAQMGPATPLVLLLPGFGPPRERGELAAALPPIEGAVCLYAPLPFTPGAPGGRPESLRVRQSADYAGALLVPLLRAAEAGIEAMVVQATSRYGLASDRPVHLFGFSMGGAAVLASLRRSALRPRSVTALNAPLSVRTAVAAYERKLRVAYTPRDPAVFDAYDLAAEAAEIRRRHPDVRLRLIQAAQDDQFGLVAARTLVRALNSRPGRNLADLAVLPRGGHNALADDPDTQRRVRRILTREVLAS